MGITRSRLGTGLGVCAAGALLLVAIPSAPAAKRGTVPFSVKVAPTKTAKFKKEITVDLPMGERKDWFFRLKLKPGEEDHAVFFDDAFTDAPHPDGYRVQWYKNGENVSSEVKGSGMDLTLNDGAPKYFQVKIRALDDPFRCVSAAVGDLEDTKYSYINLNGPCL